MDNLVDNLARRCLSSMGYLFLKKVQQGDNFLMNDYLHDELDKLMNLLIEEAIMPIPSSCQLVMKADFQNELIEGSYLNQNHEPQMFLERVKDTLFEDFGYAADSFQSQPFYQWVEELIKT